MHIDHRRRRGPATGRERPSPRALILLPLLVAGSLLIGACSVAVAGDPQVRGGAGTVASPSVSPGGDGDSGPRPSTGDGAAPADSGTVEPYVVKGHVSTAAGTPVAGAEVWADDTLTNRSTLLTKSGADGRYRIELPRSLALSWRMGGHIVTTYHGQQYDLALAVDTASFAGADGAIRDFTWRLDGAHDDDPDLYYGGLVYAYEDVNHSDLNDGGWRITFTPVGPLIDGSTGQAFTRDVVQGQIPGVPIGQYTVTATFLPSDGSGPVTLYIRPRGTGDYAPSATATFRPDSMPLMELEIVKP